MSQKKQKIDLDSMTLPELRQLHKRLVAQIRVKAAAQTRANLEDRLDQIEPPADLVTSADKRRFPGGFYVESTAAGGMKGFYAKTKSGVLFKFNAMTKTWERMPY